MTVERILLEKGRGAASVSPGASIADVIEALESNDVGAVVVSRDGSHVDGIISERDIVRALRRQGTKILDQAVENLMTRDVITCTAGDRVASVMAIMNSKGIRHVPVVDDGNLAGMVSIRDIVALRLAEVQSEADAMRLYIAGS